MIIIDPAAVRNVLGDWGNGFTDEQIVSESLATLIESEIAASCPTWEQVVDADSLAKLDVAIAYLTAARLVSNIGGVKSMTLGDQMITFNTNFIAQEQSRWRRDALALIGNVCPIKGGVFGTTGFGVHFGKASGRRG